MTRTPFSNDHVRQLQFVGAAGFVGDGRTVFYTVAEIDAELRERQSLWLVEPESSGTRRLAPDLGDVSSPAPSPDGSLIAALTEVEDKKQIVLIPTDDTEPRTLTGLSQGVAGAPVWSPDGRSVAFTAGPATLRDHSLPYRVDRTTYRFDGVGYLDDAVTDLYVVDVESGAVRQLTRDRCMNSEPRWSPDGRSLSYLVSFRPDREWDTLSELHVIDLESGNSRSLIDAWGGVFAAQWHPDGERIVFVGIPAIDRTTISSVLHNVDVWTIGVGGGEPDCRTPNVQAGAGQVSIQTDLPVMPDPRISIDADVAYLGAQVGGDAVIYRVALSGPEAVELAVERLGSAYFADFHPDRGVLYLATSFVEPPQLMLGERPLTSLNDSLLETIVPPAVRSLEVTAPDGLRIDAWALTPPGDGPWPTVLCVHGGPCGAFGSVYMIDFQLLVGAGYAVVIHNFRGSGGYGSDFEAKILGRWGEQGSVDHHAALDEAIRVGVADPDRLGVCGLSHGGFATCWLLGTSDRFRAGVAENPVNSFTSSFGVMDTAWWLRGEFGGTPYEVPEAYRERSPLTYAANCRTPLLFVVGEADWRCHAIESEQYYRVLKLNGVASEMLRLPDSSHTGSLTGPVPARIAQNEALVDWFKRYL